MEARVGRERWCCVVSAPRSAVVSARRAPAAAGWALARFASSSAAPASPSAAATAAASVPSLDDRAEKAIESGDWREFQSGSRPGDSLGPSDEFTVRMRMSAVDAAGVGERLALPNSFAEHTWAPEEDPLHKLGLGFDPSSVGYESAIPLTRAQRESARFRMGRLVANIDTLGLPPVALKWLQEVLGPRFDWETRSLRISVRRHASAAENRREAMEQLAAACRKARELEAEFGDFVQRGPITKDWGEGQRRARRRRKGNPTRPPFTLHAVSKPARPDIGPPTEQLLRLKLARMTARPYGEDVAMSVEATATASKMLDMSPQVEEQPRRKQRKQRNKGRR